MVESSIGNGHCPMWGRDMCSFWEFRGKWESYAYEGILDLYHQAVPMEDSEKGICLFVRQVILDPGWAICNSKDLGEVTLLLSAFRFLSFEWV